jgi:uncharacterized protein (TIRG00374 family)
MSSINRPGMRCAHIVSKLRCILHDPRVGWLLRLGFSALILALLFTQVDLASVLTHLDLANAQWVVPILGLYFAIHCIWAYRMSLGLKPLRVHFTIPYLFVIILISAFYSLVLPGNVITGGAVSWYKLSRSNRKHAEIGALLIYLRLIDTLTLLGIGLIGAWFDAHVSSPGFRGVVGAMLVSVVLVSLPFFFPAVTRRMEQLGQPLANRLDLPQRVRSKAGAVWRALKAFQTLKKRTIALVFGLSLVSHVLGVILFYLLALATNVHLSILVIGWIRSLVGILQLIPFSVGGLGVREASLVLLLREYGISEPQALAFSLAIFGLMVVGGLTGGVLEAWDILFSRRRTEGAVGEDRLEADTRT